MQKSMSKFRNARREKGARAQASEAEARPTSARDAQLAEQVAPQADGGMMSGDAGMAGGEDGTAHGPAQEIHIVIEPTSGAYHVTSVHPDGYEDHSDHMTPEDAHAHAARMGGVQPQGDEPETPEEAASETEYDEEQEG